MTRVLVVSPYPPSSDPLAATALDHVRALRAAGHDVDVWSPTPSAARFHGRLATPGGLLRLERAARGRDRVIVHFRPDCFPAPTSPAAQRTLAVLLRAALRDVPSVELVLHGHAADDAPMAAIFADAGARVVDEVPDSDGGRSRRPDAWPAAGGPEGIVAVQAAVRARAAEARRRRDRAAGTAETAASHHALDPIRPTVPGSSRAGVAALRRVVQRLTAWETEPIVARLNELSAIVGRDRSGNDEAAGRDPG